MPPSGISGSAGRARGPARPGGPRHPVAPGQIGV